MIKLKLLIFLCALINVSIAQDTIHINFPDELAIVRQGDIVKFSTNYKAKEFNWEFEGANIKHSNLKSPVVKYTTRGCYSIKLSIKNRNVSIINRKRAVTVTYPAYYGNNKHYIKLKNKHYWIKSSEYNIKPGDLIILEGKAKALTFVDFKGTKEKPIRIVNKGLVEISYDRFQSFGFKNSMHVIVDGKADKKYKYGFHVKANGKTNLSAVNISRMSTDIELFGVEVDGSDFAGIMAKTQPSQNNPKTWRYNFSLNNLKIHHNYIHDTKGEGMYIGYFTYSKRDDIKAHSVKNAKIYANIIENSGWDGFQIGCGDYNTEVHDNYIENYGTANERWQNSGMSINSGFSGDIFNNTIINGSGTGITLKPLDSVNIYNNVISASNRYGIYIINDETTKYECSISIYNNNIKSNVILMIDDIDSTKFKQISLINNVLEFKSADINVNNINSINSNYPRYLFSYNYTATIPKDWNAITTTPIKFNNTTTPSQYYFGNYNYLYNIRKKIRY